MTPLGAGKVCDDMAGVPGDRVMTAGYHCRGGGGPVDPAMTWCAGKPGDDWRIGPVGPVMTDDRECRWTL